MGIFDLFKKKDKGQTVASPDEELKNELLDAIKRNHLTEFEMLCRQNESRIIRNFPQWKKTPEEYRNHPEQAQLYVNCLMIMANYFARELKRDDLHQIMAGVDNSEEAQQWQADLGKVRKLMEELKVFEAVPVLEEWVQKSASVSETVAATLLPVTLGHLGECYFQMGQADKAMGPTERAMEMSERQNNQDATIAYLRNLYEIHRYLGDGKRAADCARKIAEKLYEDGKLFLSSNWKHQARAVDAGEPLLRVVLKIGDELFELNEIPEVKAEKVEFIFMRNRFELRTAMKMCEEGKKLAEEGKAEEALPLFEQSAALDPYNPTPHYFIAAIRMHQQRIADAVAAYEKTEELAPGFESCRSELWLARKIHAGELPYEAYTTMLQIVNDSTPVESRLGQAEQFLAKYPRFTECLYQKGKLLAFSKKRDEAIAAWNQALEIADDADVKARLYADLSMAMNTRAEKLELVNKGKEVPGGNLIANAMCHYVAKQLEGADDDDEEEEGDD